LQLAAWELNTLYYLWKEHLHPQALATPKLERTPKKTVGSCCLWLYDLLRRQRQVELPGRREREGPFSSWNTISEGDVPATTAFVVDSECYTDPFHFCSALIFCFVCYLFQKSTFLAFSWKMGFCDFKSLLVFHWEFTIRRRSEQIYLRVWTRLASHPNAYKAVYLHCWIQSDGTFPTLYDLIQNMSIIECHGHQAV